MKGKTNLNGSIVGDKSKAFAVRIVKLYKYLCEKNEYVISKQILRSGTSIGANIAEGRYAQSKSDFINKMSIALKEAAETEYWLELLKETDYISEDHYVNINNDCAELIKILIAIVKTGKNQ
ncbi:MAG: four helix bundle protein [Ruminiclostridium sp.]|nr:four helix bundle protein [Ruminiclostridium sp.]